jgi:hypothetical protein
VSGSGRDRRLGLGGVSGDGTGCWDGMGVGNGEGVEGKKWVKA